MYTFNGRNNLNFTVLPVFGSGGSRSEPTDPPTSKLNSALKADDFLFFTRRSTSPTSDFRISALASLVHVSLSTDLVLVSLS